MATSPRPWIVAPHEALRQLEDNLWTVDGVVPTIPGHSFPRKMMIVRRQDGTLLLHNAMPLDEPRLAELLALGRPEILVAPSPFHCIDAHAVKARLGCKLYCPGPSAAAIGQVVKVDGTLGQLPADPAVRFEPLAGTRTGEGVFFVESAGGARVSLLFCDAILNVPHLPGFFGFVWKLLGFTGGPRCGPMWLKRAVHDRAALRRDLERLATTPKLHRLVPSHGPAIEEDPAGVLGRVAASL